MTTKPQTYCRESIFHSKHEGKKVQRLSHLYSPTEDSGFGWHIEVQIQICIFIEYECVHTNVTDSYINVFFTMLLECCCYCFTVYCCLHIFTACRKFLHFHYINSFIVFRFGSSNFLGMCTKAISLLQFSMMIAMFLISECS